MEQESRNPSWWVIGQRPFNQNVSVHCLLSLMVWVTNSWKNNEAAVPSMSLREELFYQIIKSSGKITFTDLASRQVLRRRWRKWIHTCCQTGKSGSHCGKKNWRHQGRLNSITLWSNNPTSGYTSKITESKVLIFQAYVHSRIIGNN